MLEVLERISANVEGPIVVFHGSVALGNTRLEPNQGIAMSLETEDIYSFLHPLNLTQDIDAAIIFPNDLDIAEVFSVSVGLIGAKNFLRSLSDDRQDGLVSEICSSILQVSFEGSDTRDLQEPVSLYFKTFCVSCVSF